MSRLLIGLNVPVSAESEPDKSNRHQDGAGYDHPMWIFHLGTTFRAAPAARGPRSCLQFLNCPSASRFAQRQPYGGAQAGATA
jgi:hypothetical protein